MAVTAETDIGAVVVGSKTSFMAGMRVLPRARREAIHALYAFCRIVDDIADGDAPQPEKRAALDAWEEEIERLFTGRPATPLGRALVTPVARYALPREEFALVIDGMRMDVDGPVVAPDRDTLTAYVRRVAGAVGMLSMRIFGAWRGAPSQRFALALAEGLQLTNILRDVEEDAGLGRLYLPADALAAAGVPADPALVTGHPGLADARALTGAWARRRFEDARAEVGSHSRLRLAPALLMMGPYERMLREMEAQGFAGPRPRMSAGRKVWVGLGCAMRGGR